MEEISTIKIQKLKELEKDYISSILRNLEDLIEKKNKIF